MKPKPHTLFITFDGLTDPLGQSQILPYLKGLSQDFTIHIIACEKPDAYGKRKDSINDSINGYDVYWHNIDYINSPPILGSYFLQRKIKAKAKQIIHQYGIQLMHCRSYPASVIGMDLSKKLHIPFVFDMRGFWPDERVEGGIWNLKNPLYKFLYQYFKKKELQLLNSAAHIITLTHSSKNILEHKFEVKPHKISVIPCAADLDFFQHPGDEVRDKFRQKLGIKSDEKVLLYVGSVGTFYLTSEIFTFYKCKPKNLLCRLVFFSPEHSHNYIHSLIQKFELNASECIVQYVNREDLTHYLSIGDLSVIFIKPSFSKQASSPTKHGELTAMHIPCVVNKNVGDMEMIVSDKPTGYVLNDFSEKEMQKAWDYITQTKFNSSDFDFIAQKYYALDKGIVTYKDIYFKTINNRA